MRNDVPAYAASCPSTRSSSVGWPHELVHLEGCLGGVEDDRHGSRRAFRGAQQRDRLLCDPSGVPGEVERLDGLPSGADLMAPEAVRKAAGLDVIVTGGRGVETATGFDDRLIQHGSFAACEMAHLANELERALANPDLGHVRHREVGPQEQVDLVVERDRKRDRERPASGTRRPVPAPGASRTGTRLTRDDALAIRTACRAASSMLGAAEIVDTGESPGAAGDHADADALILEQLHRRHGAVLDGEPLHRAIDDPAIGIRRTRG